MEASTLNPNDGIGRRMRFCDVCGVAMGLMTHNAYVERFVHRKSKCPYCGHSAVQKQPEEEAWLSVMAAHVRYNVSLTKLWKMTHEGKMRWREGVDRSGKLIPEAELMQFGRREL